MNKLFTSLLTLFLATVIMSGCNVNVTNNVTPDEEKNTTKSVTEETATEVEADISPKTSEENEAQTVTKDSGLSEKIRQELSNGNDFQVTKKPMFPPLPEDINEAQIDKYYIIGDIFLALVRRPSMNVPMNLPEGFDASFAGIIAADSNEDKWEKILTITDKDPTNKNNPYAIWTERTDFLLTIVDQNGAGSGEGIMKLIGTSDFKNWKQLNCFYFGSSYGGPEDGDYFEFSRAQEGHPHEEYSGENCSNYTLK